MVLSILSCLFVGNMMADLNRKSRYSLVLTYALQTRPTISTRSRETPTIGSNRIKMNSYLVPFTLVIMYKDSFFPLSLVWISRLVIVEMQLKPMVRLILGLLIDCQMSLRFVTINLPISPVFPLVSSTLAKVSIIFSPGRKANSLDEASKRMSRSCHNCSKRTFRCITLTILGQWLNFRLAEYVSTNTQTHKHFGNSQHKQ